MPLLDHFHPPVLPRHPWESFHFTWANSIMARLNELLPQRYLATMHTHLGSQVEADVAEFERDVHAEEAEAGNGISGVAVAVQPWAPPVATLVLPAVFPDDLEVQVRDLRDDARLVAVVELLSPANHDRPEARRAFAAKCAACLQKGIGLITVDIVTSHHFNPHNLLIDLLELDAAFRMAGDPVISAVAYRPARRQETNQVDVWPVALTVGSALPLLPLALRGARAVPLDLEATYTEARQRSRL